MKKLTDILFESLPGQGKSNEIHVFDFDETLGETLSLTLHVGVIKTETGWKPIKDYHSYIWYAFSN